ncbi:hypothetical protein AVEN_92597-1 [Araneus ventricosus]|uniref:Uncharacterized protein n=1 Tax=Araneus ventricosus TaxID=182803 RepID=A0A4Y2AJG5_ARAVE|nr:hypothetical protein AVEN_92597-1 [Araneus ventricosus]
MQNDSEPHSIKPIEIVWPILECQDSYVELTCLRIGRTTSKKDICFLKNKSPPALIVSSARPSPRVLSPTENHELAQDFQRGSSSPAPYMGADGLESNDSW